MLFLRVGVPLRNESWVRVNPDLTLRGTDAAAGAGSLRTAAGADAARATLPRCNRTDVRPWSDGHALAQMRQSKPNPTTYALSLDAHHRSDCRRDREAHHAG